MRQHVQRSVRILTRIAVLHSIHLSAANSEGERARLCKNKFNQRGLATLTIRMMSRQVSRMIHPFIAAGSMRYPSRWIYKEHPPPRRGSIGFLEATVCVINSSARSADARESGKKKRRKRKRRKRSASLDRSLRRVREKEGASIVRGGAIPAAFARAYSTESGKSASK